MIPPIYKSPRLVKPWGFPKAREEYSGNKPTGRTAEYSLLMHTLERGCSGIDSQNQ